jgi:hypothetical protein
VYVCGLIDLIAGNGLLVVGNRSASQPHMPHPAIPRIYSSFFIHSCAAVAQGLQATTKLRPFVVCCELLCGGRKGRQKKNPGSRKRKGEVIN